MGSSPVQTVPPSSLACLESGGRARWWRRCGSPRRGFRYVDAEGKPITDTAQLERIQSLALPPAWTDVHICPSKSGRLQALGVDKHGKIQYRYHARFVEQQQKVKYDRLIRFGESLPCIREVTNEHIALEGLPRERVLAVMVRLIGELYFRVGSEQSAKQYRTYGITTLQNRHLVVDKDGVLLFRFLGKRQVRQRKVLADPDLAELMNELRSLPGSRLFQYLGDNGKPHPVKPSEVNRYIKTILGAEFSAKDFRTWAGTLNTALFLADVGPVEGERAQQKNIVAAVRHTAERLGNTPAVCRSAYIHPGVLQQYQHGVTLSDYRPRSSRVIRRHQPGYEPEEYALLALLREAR